MAKMTIDARDRARLILTRDQYGNLVGQELPVPWHGGAPPKQVNVSTASCPDCEACVDGTWEGGRCRCKCGWVGYYPRLRFEKKYV
jgi:hypothetical protein